MSDFYEEYPPISYGTYIGNDGVIRVIMPPDCAPKGEWVFIKLKANQRSISEQWTKTPAPVEFTFATVNEDIFLGDIDLC